MFEPTLVFFPQIPRRNPKTPILNFLRVQLFYIALGPMSAIFTLKALLTGQRKGRWQDYLTYLTWLGMIAMRYKETKSRKTSFLEGSGLYLLMRLVCSYYQISVGLYAGHHADYIYRQGDAFKHPRDFGLYQLEVGRHRLASSFSPD